ncbi:MAG: DUF192 domain-containing protein [Robiginitomaculum sp.]
MKHLMLTAFIAASLTSIPALFGPAAFAQAKPAPLDFGKTEPLVIKSKDKTHTFDVEVADTDKLQARGLMYRDAVGADDGMIFEFNKSKVATIWMKNTGIFLDILFVRPNGKILKIEHNAKPYSLRLSSSEAPVAAVVELRGGRAQELGIRPGDVIEHEFFKAN